ncbi:MAG: hypothetical protein JO157_12015 [Acetobacteraceae bacterium]|nr:hypothetical protein [Acetobacteraceae bacterium]
MAASQPPGDAIAPEAAYKQRAGALGTDAALSPLAAEWASLDTPAAWLRYLRRLVDEGRDRDARTSLAELRRRYPEVELPAPLARRLQTQP